MAAPVFDETRDVTMALSAVGPKHRMTHQRLRECRPLVLECARNLQGGAGDGGAAECLAVSLIGGALAIRLDVSCASPTDALDVAVPYALVVTIEVRAASTIDVYTKIKARRLADPVASLNARSLEL